MAEDATTQSGDDVAAAFAATMTAAAHAAGGGDEAPFGYTTDRASGEVRPKKVPGRPRKSPTLDELKSAAAEPGEGGGARPGPGPDQPPGKSRRSRRPGGGAAGAPAAPAPPYRPGVIHAGMNRIYRRAGRIVAVMDAAVGEAITECATDDEDGTGSAGWAWEELARTNPGVRALLMKALTGGAWGALVLVHAPVAMAIVMKDAIRRRIPFARLFDAAAGPAGNGAGTVPGEAAGAGPADVAAMMNLAQEMMGRIDATAAAAGAPRQARRGPAAAETGG